MQHTEEQLAVIHHSDGHACVSACAGSGKSTTMVDRIVELLSQGVDARRVRVLMFNKDAQQEFSRRLKKRLPKTRLPKVQTFHGLVYALCNQFVDWGYLRPAKLETSEGVLGMLAGMALKSAAPNTATEQQEDFLTYITFVKSGFSSPREIAEDYFDEVFEFDVAATFNAFEQLRQQRGLRFFDDLLYDAANALLNDADLRARVADHLDHIIVDEYQDVNEVQQLILRVLAGTRAQVMVVGDADQCIYEWRGARPEYITSQFAVDFPGAVRYNLTRTFRFGHSLALAANHSIRFNTERDNSLCVSSDTCPPTHVFHYATKSPHKKVVQIVKKALENGWKQTDVAILLRLYAMSLPAEIGLLLADIPYRLEGGRTALERDELKGLLAYFAVATGDFPWGERQRNYEDALLILQTPPIGLRRQDVEDLARRIAASPGLAPNLIRDAAAGGNVASIVKEKLERRARMWLMLRQRGPDARAKDILGMLIKDLEMYEGFRYFSQRAETAFDKQLLVSTMEDIAKEAGFTVRDYVEFVASLRAKVAANQNRTDAVLMTSMHRAKGLEWPIVIIPSLIEGQFPFYAEKTGLSEEQEEAERRLYYVAITRARNAVYLVHPGSYDLDQHFAEYRGHQPRTVTYGGPSRFLFESNVQACQTLGQVIHSSKEPITYTGIGTDVITRYAQEVGANHIEVEEAPSPTTPQDQSQRGAEGPPGFTSVFDRNGNLRGAHRGAIVHHETLGSGRILEIHAGRAVGESTRLIVKFAGKDPRDYGPDAGLLIKAS